MSSIDYNEIQKNYNNIDEIWTKEDSWHFYTFGKIKKFIKNEINGLDLKNNFTLLNAGSAGNDYEINCKKHIHVDLIEKNIIDKAHYIIGTIEKLPLKDHELDFILFYV